MISSTTYRGDYGFEVSFQHQSKDTKSATWTVWIKLFLVKRISISCTHFTLIRSTVSITTVLWSFGDYFDKVMIHKNTEIQL